MKIKTNRNMFYYLLKIIKKDSNRVVDSLICKNHYAFIEKLHVFLANHNKMFVCRRCLNSYTSENMLMIHKPKCETYDITTIGTSSEPNYQWRKKFHKKPLFFRIDTGSEADIEIDKSNKGNKKINTNKQNPVLMVRI